MSAWVQSETFLLDLANVALGVAMLACLLWVAYGVVLELLALPQVRSSLGRDHDHVLLTPDLGLTMADGGRRVAAPPRRLIAWRRRPR